MKKIFYYTGGSPFVQRYVDLKNQDGWYGWTDREINELIQGYWVTEDTPMFEPNRSVIIQPNVLEYEDSEINTVVNSRLESLRRKEEEKNKKKEKVKKVEKNFDISEKATNFIKKLKTWGVLFIKKLLMENE